MHDIFEYEYKSKQTERILNMNIAWTSLKNNFKTN